MILILIICNNSRVNLTKRATYLQTVLKNFWSRWKHEYLLELRESHRRKHKGIGNEVTVGDVVIIHDDTPRGLWRLGVIEEKIVGKDNNARGAIVRVKAGRGPSAFLRRPVQKLYPLEASQEEIPNIDSTNDEVNESLQEESTCIIEQEDNRSRNSIADRPKRRAATEARDVIVASLLD